MKKHDSDMALAVMRMRTGGSAVSLAQLYIDRLPIVPNNQLTDLNVVDTLITNLQGFPEHLEVLEFGGTMQHYYLQGSLKTVHRLYLTGRDCTFHFANMPKCKSILVSDSHNCKFDFTDVQFDFSQDLIPRFYGQQECNLAYAAAYFTAREIHTRKMILHGSADEAGLSNILDVI